MGVVNGRLIARFLLAAFGISWSVAAATYLAGIEAGSIPFLIIVAIFYMPAPAYAALLVTGRPRKEQLAGYGLVLPKRPWSSFVVASFVLPLLLVGCTFVAVEVLPGDAFGSVDFSEESFLRQLKSLAPAGQEPPTTVPIPPILIFAAGLVQGLIAGATINALFALGEELGWRGLLQRETEMLGFWKSNLLIGVVWGVWHAPIILQGHNYGRERGAIGVAVMTLFTIAMSFPLAYARWKSRTVLAPAIFHGIVNAIGGLTVLFIAGANPLFGHVAGIAGIVSAAAVMLGIVALDGGFRQALASGVRFD